MAFRLESKPEFDEETLPERDNSGLLVYRHALHLKPHSAQQIWLEGLLIKEALCGQQDSQIIIFQRRDDVTIKLPRHSLLRSLTSYPVVTTDVARVFLDNEPKNESGGLVPGVKSIYGIASIVDQIDIFAVIATAARAKNEIGAKCFTLICPFLAGTRQDKNINKVGAIEHQAININQTNFVGILLK